MPILTEIYKATGDLPPRIAVFPLRGAILLPRATLPLNIFEPRYLEMLNDVISGSRVLGIIQPDGVEGERESPAGKGAQIRRIGCAGRVTAYQEIEDGRLIVSLTGIARFEVRTELATAKPYRTFEVSYDRYAGDLEVGRGEDEVDRERLLSVLKTYLDRRGLKADWSVIERSTTEQLINSLSLISPYSPEEKQALLEAESVKARAEVLLALAEMELAERKTGSGTRMQ